MIQISLTEIKKKKQTVEKARIILKKEFVGIDQIIDSLLDYIEVWYLMPEILTRPVIVNLWGMTGVGKTDLIRKMVKLLDYQDRFAEIELSNLEGSSWEKSVSGLIEKNGIADEKPSIILFDEIQRFNTIDVDGKPLLQSKFTDFWELLSDGKLARKQKEDLDYQLYSMMAQQKDLATRKANGEEILPNTNNMGLWEARELKRMLGLDETLDELIGMSPDSGISFIQDAKKKKKIYEPVSYAKSLIIISGNLDEAFNMAGATSETDIDADIFNAFTKKITMVDVKNSLTRKFRPEQVARFGNIHLIYNSLNKKNFVELISKEMKRIIVDTQSNFGITLTIDSSINDLVYRNGVFPVQGVRPVFSSIVDIVETNLSKYLYKCIMAGNKRISMGFDRANNLLIADIDGDITKTPYTGRVDKIRESNQHNAIANISVHESGHAVIYMLLFGLVPLQLKSRLANSYAGGFTFPHEIHETKQNIIHKIMIYLAGGLAEELVFGDEFVSVGRGNDWEKLTQLTLDYIRKYGFSNDFQANYALDQYPYTMNKNITDSAAESLINELTKKTKDLLFEYKSLLLELSSALNESGSLLPKDIQTIAKNNTVSTEIKEEGFLIIDNYSEKLSNHEC